MKAYFSVLQRQAVAAGKSHPLLGAQAAQISTASAAEIQEKGGAQPRMPETSHKPAPYQGPSYEKIRSLRESYVTKSCFTLYEKPLYVVEGHMQYVWDQESKRYLDMFGGICTVSVGHSHPKVAKRVADQMQKLQHMSTLYYLPHLGEYAEKLLSKFPSELNMKRVIFVNSGSEANDMACMLARLHTGNWELLSLRHSYHGMSPHTMGLTALRTFKYKVPHQFGMLKIPRPDTYRGRYAEALLEHGKSEKQILDMYRQDVQESLTFDTCGRVAGLIAEPIQGVGGTGTHMQGALRVAQEEVHAAGGVYISDEVQTGFGRLGTHFWGFERLGLRPDIVSMAKSIGNGAPLAAVVTTEEIASGLDTALRFNTYGGNPVACLIGQTVLEIMEEEDLMGNCLRVGETLMEGLQLLKKKHEIVGDVRGQGLMLGMELVTDRETKEPAAKEMLRVLELTKEMGLLIGKGGIHGNVARIKPPMCITKDDAEFAIDVLDIALGKL